MGKEYDVLVVGGGPGGLVAAWSAATLGASVVCLEEHAEIGNPRHCSGFIQGSSFAEELFKKIDNRVILNHCTKHRIFSPSGKFIADVPINGRGCCMVLREEFDKELARQAVKTGAELRLNTRVDGIWREDGRVKGIVAKRGSEKISGKVVIAADGLRALEKGIPHQEGLVPPERQRFAGGLNIEFTNVGGLEAGVLEFWPVDFMNFGVNYVIDGSSCVFGFESLKEYERIRKLNHPAARKFKNAGLIRIMGYRWSATEWYLPIGQKLPKTVLDGVLFIGDAGGYIGATCAMVSGKYAAQVAAQAIRAKDTSEARLLEYEELCRPLQVMHPAASSLATLLSSELTEEMLEERLAEMARQNQLNLLDQCPF